MSYQEQIGTFTFNGFKSSDFGVWVSDVAVYNAAARRYQSITVPGRNGTLTIQDDTFDEADHIYTCFIPGNGSAAQLAEFRDALNASAGYKRLLDTMNPDEYYRARFMDGLQVTPAPAARGMEFTVSFKRDPRRFLRSGESSVSFTANGTLTNPTHQPARPLIHVYGNGNFTIGGTGVTVKEGYADLYIDCESQEVYRGGTSRNSYVTFQYGKFPVLKAGANGVTLTGNITRVDVVPRWCRI